MADRVEAPKRRLSLEPAANPVHRKAKGLIYTRIHLATASSPGTYTTRVPVGRLPRREVGLDDIMTGRPAGGSGFRGGPCAAVEHRGLAAQGSGVSATSMTLKRV